jgi:hypothetical protein
LGATGAGAGAAAIADLLSRKIDRTRDRCVAPTAEMIVAAGRCPVAKVNNASSGPFIILIH